MLAKAGMGEAHTVPGAVESGLETDRFTEGGDGFGPGATQFAHKAKVVVAGGIVGGDAQGFLEPALRVVVILAADGDGGQVAG